MGQISFFFFFIFTLSAGLFFLSLFFKSSKTDDPWSNYVFECGFESSSILPPPFSLHFFSITIVFLIFDLEIVVLIPLFLIESSFYSIFMKMMILFIILAGLGLEWFDGSLDWDL